MSISRDTTRKVTIDVQVLLPKPYSRGKFFRTTLLTETLRECDDPAAWESKSNYSVKVTGPVQTAKGNDHADQRGGLVWSMRGGISDGHLDDMPSEIRALCVGPVVLRTWEGEQ